MVSDSASARGLPGSEDDLSSMRLKGTLDKAFIVAAAALGAGLVLLRLASYGPSVGSDAAHYIVAARNLLAGEGLIGLGGGPLVHWPPLYPALLAGGGLFGVDPYAVAGPLNAVVFGLTVLVAGWWLRRHMHSRLLWLWGCLSIALALPLAEIASHALSEAVFILFVTLALTQVDAHLRGGERATMARAAAFSALACLTRYMGASVILVVVPMLLAARVAPWEKMKRIVVYTLIAAAPVGLWILRNFLIAGSMTGERGKGFYSFDFIVGEALRIAAKDWWLVGLTAPVLLTLVMAAGHGFRRRADRKRGAAVASDIAWGPLRVFGGFALAYLTLLVAAMMAGLIGHGLEWRYVAPVYIPLLFAALLLMDGVLQYTRRRAPRGIAPRRRGVQTIRTRGTLAAVLMLGLSLQVALLVALNARYISLWNAGVRQGYGEQRWGNSESVQYIREAALTGTILSNHPIIPGLHADSPARRYRLLCESDRVRSALSDALGSGEVHVLYFHDLYSSARGWWWNPCSQQQDEDLGNAVSREPLLELVAELADGKLYRPRERDFREFPPAMFHSSDAPMEGKSFGAFLSKSHGQRLPGEPWRWEKGSDADGWTSLPAQQSTYVYTPTVADVGYRLRASVYYEDRLGNRVKAITKPSEPVQPDILKMLASPGSEDDRGAVGVSEADRIIRSKYDVYLHGNRLIYEKQNCRWADEVGTRFPLVVYSLASESGTSERDTLDFEWHENFWKNNGTCLAERQLPDKNIVGIQTGQVDPDRNLLWEAGRWFKESQRWLDGYLSSSASSEPATRNVFDIYLGKGNLIFVKDSCIRADTGAMFFLHLIPADVNDLPDHRKQYGFDNLDFYFDQHGGRFDSKCLAVRALPEYDIVGVRAGQFEGNSRFWTAEIPIP